MSNTIVLLLGLFLMWMKFGPILGGTNMKTKLVSKICNLPLSYEIIK